MLSPQIMFCACGRSFISINLSVPLNCLIDDHHPPARKSSAEYNAGLLAAMLDVIGWDARSAATIVGTSAGASTAALVRAGLDGADLVRRACGEAPTARVAPLLARMGVPLDVTELRSRKSRRVGRRPASPQLLLRAV